MNAEERGLIIGLFDRMSKIGGIEKDRDAAELITDEVRHNPDAPYLLTQSVLVQEQALQRADARIRELEEKLREVHAAAPQPSSRSSVSSTGFLGGGSRATSVPATDTARNRSGDRAAAPGGFMAQAMSTAAGVAGGMLLASGISSLLGGDSASASKAANNATEGAAETPVADQNAAADPSQAAEYRAENLSDMDSVDEAEHVEDDGGWGEWDDFGSDTDI